MAADTAVPFSIREEEIDNSPRGWNYTRVTIHDDDGREIGGYERNYPRFAASTFCPFHLHDRWWALYSRDYTATRIMTLPECEDWCGEEPNPTGFCPTGYHVPRYRPAKRQTDSGIYDEYIGEGAWGWDDPAKTNYVDIGDPLYCPFGLVSGCIWGDDTSWKVQYIDLAGLPEKRFIRDDRFGYFELFDKDLLRDCLDMSGWRLDDPAIGLRGVRWQRVDTGGSVFPANR